MDIENIDERRRQLGIDDIELRDEIRNLKSGNVVNLSFMTGEATYETLLVSMKE